MAVSRKSLQKVFCMLWAAMVGVSVPLEMVNTIFLNSNVADSDRKYHAFYVANLAVAMGALELLPLSVVRTPRSEDTPKWRWWHFAGGVCSLPAFFTIPAGHLLGTQAVLVVQLAALLTTFFIIDLVDGRVKLTELVKVGELILIFGGVVLENVGGKSGVAGSIQAVVMLLLVALTGIGYAVQSKCNNALSQVLGSTARATIVSACVNLLCAVPIDLYIGFGLNIAPSFDTRLWYLWVVAGLQSAFYIGSMAYLTGVLGFTSCYVITLVAKLSSSLAVDAKGLSGEVVPVSVPRVLALIIVLLGSVVFNFRKHSDADENDEEACVLTLSSVTDAEAACDAPDGMLEDKLALPSPTEAGILDPSKENSEEACIVGHGVEHIST